MAARLQIGTYAVKSVLPEWFTAQDLAGLDGLPSTARNIRSRADRESWQSRPRKGRGGGREYHISSLPEVTRIHLTTQAASAAPVAPNEAPQTPPPHPIHQ